LQAFSNSDIAALIEDHSQAGRFRVARAAYCDPELFELEVKRVFESTWVFVGLESQVAKPHQFITDHVGRQPILIMRGGDDRVRCFLNSCPHRGTLLCGLREGRQRSHTCRYHGWVFDSSGENRLIVNQESGQYPENFAAQAHGLVPVARFAIYRGFMFASLSPAVPTLEEYLGDARVFLDVVADQAPDGLEYIPGSVGYTFDANWKFQFENGLDFYHFATVHSSFVAVLQHRAAHGMKPPGAPSLTDPDPMGTGTFSFKHGHAIMWSIGVPGQGPDNRPLGHNPEFLRFAREKYGEDHTRWMLRHRNLTIFPNLQLIDIQSLQIRTWRPLAVDKTEMMSHCVGPIGEGPAVRRFRIRQYEDFFNPSGLATSDDNVAYDFCQEGMQALSAGWTQGYLRGLGRTPAERVDYRPQLGLGEDTYWTYGRSDFGDETAFHAGWREWRRLMTQLPA
jgi:benzoate/toluate 1,2-dioxygenase alpha subunit/2,4,5-trichlorophenoxyacetic acid oxygenase 1